MGYEHLLTLLTRLVGPFRALWTQTVSCKMQRCGDFQSEASPGLSPLMAKLSPSLPILSALGAWSHCHRIGQ